MDGADLNQAGGTSKRCWSILRSVCGISLAMVACTFRGNLANVPHPEGDVVHGGGDRVGFTITGTVFEDVDFAGVASGWDGGVSDRAIVGAAVEVYRADISVGSTTTSADGSFEVTVLEEGEVAVRVVSASLGRPPALPALGLNQCPTCAAPLPEMTWGNGPRVGGEDPTHDDTTTAAGAGKGDTYVLVAITDGAPSQVEIGFAYNVVVDLEDDGSPDNQRSKQGTLRQFLKNSAALGRDLLDTPWVSYFRVPPAALIAGEAVFALTAPLPVLDRPGLWLDGQTQIDVTGETKRGHPVVVLDGSDPGAVTGLRIVGSSVAVRRLSIRGFPLAAVSTGQYSDGTRLSQNVIRDNGAEGILLSYGAGVAVYHNVIYQNGGDGVRVESGALDAIVRNNLLLFNGGAALVANAELRAGYNVYSGNATDGCEGCVGGVDADSRALDPAVVDASAGDFTPVDCASPLVNSGFGAHENQPDVNGDRPGLYDSAFPDIGVVETACAIDTCVVTTTSGDTGAGSYRACLAEVNAAGGRRAIAFDIPGPPNQGRGADGWWRISLPGNQSVTVSNLLIDGDTQRVNQGDTNASGPEIELYGPGLGNPNVGINVDGDNVTVRNLAVNNFEAFGIWVKGNRVRLHGNYLGIAPSGNVASPNGNGGGVYGSRVDESELGGRNPGEGNVVSGNSSGGWGFGNGGRWHYVYGNKIGTNPTGSAAVPNGGTGVHVWRFEVDPFPGPSDVHIGGAASGAGNLVSGNLSEGIRVAAGNSVDIYVFGNTVGTDITGTQALGNGDVGVQIIGGVVNDTTRTHIVIGGADEGQGNLIAHNGAAGISASWNSGQDDEVIGNFIHHNGAEGILWQRRGGLIGRNVVWANAQDGIWLNYGVVRTDIIHNTVHGNGDDGIHLGGDDNAVVANNIVSGNVGLGLNTDTAFPLMERHNIIRDAGVPLGNALGASNRLLDASDWDVEPGFVDAAVGDFEIAVCTSLAVDGGVHLGLEQVDMNGSGAGLFNGSLPDIGALESECP